MDGESHSKVAATFATGSTTIPLYMYVVAATASLNSIDYGFDIGVSLGVALYLRESFELRDVQIGWFSPLFR